MLNNGVFAFVLIRDSIPVLRETGVAQAEPILEGFGPHVFVELCRACEVKHRVTILRAGVNFYVDPSFGVPFAQLADAHVCLRAGVRQFVGTQSLDEEGVRLFLERL